MQTSAGTSKRPAWRSSCGVKRRPTCRPIAANAGSRYDRRNLKVADRDGKHGRRDHWRQ
jgi:hypothetical protein